MRTPDLSRFITLPEAAAILGVKPALLRTWRHRGVGPKSRKVGHAVVYLRRDLETWIERQEETA